MHIKKFIALVALVLLGLTMFTVVRPAEADKLSVPGSPSGEGIQPIFKKGNLACSELAPEADWFEFKVEPVKSGSYSDGPLTVTINVRDTASGPVFDWSSNIGIDAIFVKGGSDGNFYLYDPPAENKDDTNLHAPVNPNNGKFFGLSHVSFCYDIRPSIKVEKTGDELSKVGDKVTYNFKITNDGDISLKLKTINDTLLGDLADEAPAACDTLAAGASCNFNVDRTVQAGDPDPLPNTVTVEYEGSLPNGQKATVKDTDDHSVNLFQPSITFDKTSGTTLSKVGDLANYTLTLTNTSSDDAPDLECRVTDQQIGLNEQVTLASGKQHVINKSYTFQSDDNDPFINTAEVSCSPKGFPNVLKKQDTHEVNLFQPSITIDKTGDERSKIGDDVNYTIKVVNTSSKDSPNLSCTISDPLLGVSQNVNLAPGQGTEIKKTRKVQENDPDPLVNKATVNCTVDGFPNKLSAEDTHSTNLFQPSVDVLKEGPATAQVGQKISYKFTIRNTSSDDSPNLVLDSVSDTILGNLTANAATAGCNSLASGASCSFNVDYTIPAGGPDPLVNVVTVHYHPDYFPNDIKDSDDHSVDIIVPTEGCTPGYWKNHKNAWIKTGYSPNQTLESVFDVPDSLGIDNDSLLKALQYPGGSGVAGGARILLRAAVAALLNAAHPDVDYPRTANQIITEVNAALASNNRAQMLELAGELDADNNLGCPLN